MKSLFASLRLAGATLLVCVLGYTLLVLGIARNLTPDTAEGSLISGGDGRALGSHLIAQKFERSGYFWPRPSAPDYDASRAAGSNESPTSTNLTERAAKLATLYGATVQRPLPADLAAASGSGLDPHITERAALYQVARVARARGLAPNQLETLIAKRAFSPGGPFTQHRLVNVLELNLRLDELLTKQVTKP